MKTHLQRQTPYTLEQAVKVARYLEKKFKSFDASPVKGSPYAHFALGGSCLHRGQSDNDIDLYIYASSEAGTSVDPYIVIHRLKEVGCEIRGVLLRYNSSSYVKKPLIKITVKGYPVDLFFITWKPEESERDATTFHRKPPHIPEDTLDEDVPF